MIDEMIRLNRTIDFARVDTRIIDVQVFDYIRGDIGDVGTVPPKIYLRVETPAPDYDESFEVSPSALDTLATKFNLPLGANAHCNTRDFAGKPVRAYYLGRELIGLEALQSS